MILHKKTSSENIMEALSSVSGYSTKDLKSSNRDASVSQWRHLGMYAARKKGYTLVEVGKMFNRHFSTVIMAEKKVDKHKAKVSGALDSLYKHIEDYEDRTQT
tara:strand:- start:4919 stop:5227 length:309 start_codon:yes stop_codon:yes gene_type:complete